MLRTMIASVIGGFFGSILSMKVADIRDEKSDEREIQIIEAKK